MAYRSTTVTELYDKLEHQMKLVARLEQQLQNLTSPITQHNCRMIIKQYLNDIRNHIEDLGDRETQLQNNNLLLKNKVFLLRQEIDELTVARRKLSSPKTPKTSPIKPRSINTTATKTLKFNIASMNPMVMPKPISPIPIERITGPQSIFAHKYWRFESLKNAMADSHEIETISKTLGIKTLPEMVFPNSYLKVSFPNSLEMRFEAVNGLKPCVGEPTKEKQVEVQYAEEWKNKAKNSKDIERLKFDYDWTFTTDYKGDYISIKTEDEEKKGLGMEYDVKERFNMVMLRDTTIPILWSCNCVLYEDELSDNGMSQLLVRCRVMPTGFLILLRFWLRVDNVIRRVNDTRIYHEFGSKYVLRHFEEREAKWSKLKKKYPMTQLMEFVDPNFFADKIDILHTVYDKILL